MFSKLKQIKDLRDKAKTLQEALKTVSVEGSAAWGKVKITMDGNQHVTAVAIDPSLLAANEKGKLESAIAEAFNDTVKKAQQKIMEKMRDMGELNLPGLT